MLFVLLAAPALAIAEFDACAASDDLITASKQIICASLGSPCGGNITAEGDWPNQAIYMRNLVAALADPGTCLNTTVARETVAWLNVVDPNVSAWWDTWTRFQVQYYDMPHRAGARVESAATLGRKCWAFAYLAQVWNDPPAGQGGGTDGGVSLRRALQDAASAAGLSVAATFARTTRRCLHIVSM